MTEDGLLADDCRANQVLRDVQISGAARGSTPPPPPEKKEKLVKEKNRKKK